LRVVGKFLSGCGLTLPHKEDLKLYHRRQTIIPDRGVLPPAGWGCYYLIKLLANKNKPTNGKTIGSASQNADLIKLISASFAIARETDYSPTRDICSLAGLFFISQKNPSYAKILHYKYTNTTNCLWFTKKICNDIA
jgi:hypothetical protein